MLEQCLRYISKSLADIGQRIVTQKRECHQIIVLEPNSHRKRRFLSNITPVVCWSCQGWAVCCPGRICTATVPLQFALEFRSSSAALLTIVHHKQESRMITVNSRIGVPHLPLASSATPAPPASAVDAGLPVQQQAQEPRLQRCA